MTPTHEDERRILWSWPEAKLITAKNNCVIGKHWHEKKTEVFILSTGTCKLFLYPESDVIGGRIPIFMQIGKQYWIYPRQYHEFHLSTDSELIGLNSRAYDPSDDYRLEMNLGDSSSFSGKDDENLDPEIKVAVTSPESQDESFMILGRSVFPDFEKLI